MNEKGKQNRQCNYENFPYIGYHVKTSIPFFCIILPWEKFCKCFKK